ncbi:MAG: hypothetical protein ACREOG_18975, partial [Gemmatimonadaceae bacterium]
GILAAPAYTSFVKEIYNRKPAPPDWPRPATVISQLVDASPDCSGAETYVDYALIGSESSVCAGSSIADIFQIGTPAPRDTPATNGNHAAGGTVPPPKPKKDTLQNPFKIP